MRRGRHIVHAHGHDMLVHCRRASSRTHMMRAGPGCVCNSPVRLLDGSYGGVYFVCMQTRGAKPCFFFPIPA